jgi:hypothetical protein
VIITFNINLRSVLKPAANFVFIGYIKDGKKDF